MDPAFNVDPAFKERVTAAFDGLAAGYDTEPGGFFGPVSDLLVQLAGLRPGQAVLEVGCGAGACLLAAAGAVGPAGHVTGIDLAAGMLARAAAAAARLGLGNVTVEPGDAEDPAYPGASFDVVRRVPAPAAVRLGGHDGGHAAAHRLPGRQHHAAGGGGQLRRPGRLVGGELEPGARPVLGEDPRAGPASGPRPGRPAPGPARCSNRCGRRTAACAAPWSSATRGPVCPAGS